MFWNKKTPEQPKSEPKTKSSLFSTETVFGIPRSKIIRNAVATTFQRDASLDVIGGNTGMDSVDIKSNMYYNGYGGIPDNQVSWYGSQGFIGHQVCAMISQHWLVQKACVIPARDAIRKGYEITINNGEDADPAILDKLKEYDKKFNLDKSLVEFTKMNRVFGIRIAIFKVQSTDPLYYEKPFNIDGVSKGSYKGISQVDPYWCTPILESAQTSDPTAINFYEPEYWMIGGKKHHRSHLIIIRGDEVPDILKPTYLYGGLSIPQKIYERTYAAERTANEAPQLVTTKRTNIYKTDIAAAMANQEMVESKLNEWAYFRDNYGVKLVDKEDEDIAQFDTALGDLDAIIMTQYQLVSSVANVPATKLLGTTPKGFNSTGEYEEANYREELESIQSFEMKPLIERHHDLVCKAYIEPEFGIKVTTETNFHPLDSLTEVEQADVNLKKAQTDQVLAASGAIDGLDIRNRIIADKKSGYNGIEEIEDDYEEENSTIPEAE